MIDDSKSLYSLGGISAILSGLLMVFISIWFLFRSDSQPDVMHGVSVVMLILVVPTVIAITVLLIKEVKTGTLLGVGFAGLWIMLELIAHCSQSAPLKTVNVLLQETTTQDFGQNFNQVWEEWGDALMMIAAFSFSVSAICYSTSLRKWGNSISAYLLILSAIVFLFTFIPMVDLYWHILIRGIAVLFLGGVLLSAPGQTIEEEWET
ncbi:MAG: hypothetical protein OXD54_16875 [Candidatus Poribacteria bacterium]|nr:hypothetical protein [Candidatus Poribacteria bacterium]